MAAGAAGRVLGRRLPAARAFGVRRPPLVLLVLGLVVGLAATLPALYLGAAVAWHR